ncbi:MAG: flagellar motor switch protein FliN [Ruminococcus sp.]|jgi:flagellar motor switch protein FliN/FliY|nr:flagellar motor switch protein FliN [Ruminococcus sp.]
MSADNTSQIFGDIERDAIGEIMNITMGSAATAVSTMLSAKVWITTPQVSVMKRGELTFPELEPSVIVKITYIQGIKGQNVLVLKQSDVQLILAQLMGMPLEVTDDFQFDEMNVSAVCEVMNQMMGASATALSEIIDTAVDISTPQAVIQEGDAEVGDLYGFEENEDVCVVKFQLTIDNVINSEFISVLTIELAKEMADKMMNGFNTEPEPEPEPVSSGGGSSMSQEQIEAMLSGSGGASSGVSGVNPAEQGMPGGMPGMNPMPNMAAMGSPQMPADAYPNGQIPYGYPPMPNMAGAPGGVPPMPYGYPVSMPYYPAPGMQNVQLAQFQAFENYTNPTINKSQNDNLKLLMDVPLDVTVEIGSATKKVKEILEFSQGTIIELERQAGAPVDIIVNGNLVAKGDVVVIDDNFAVRITEIIKSRFLESIGGER